MQKNADFEKCKFGKIQIGKIKLRKMQTWRNADLEIC